MSESNAKPPRTPAELQAALGKRLRWAVVGSLIVNAIGWSVGLAIIKHRDAVRQQYVTLARIENKKLPQPKVKKIPAKQKTPKKQVVKPLSTPKQKAPPKPPASPPAAPKIVTANASGPGTLPGPNDFNVVSGAEKAGKPFDPNANGKGNNEATVPPVTPPPIQPVKPEPKPEPKPDPKSVVIAKADPKPVPVPIPIPKPRGLTRKAEPQEPLSAIQVSIPGDLQPGEYQPFARILLQIDEQGHATVTLKDSSGNADIDRRVLEAARKVQWQPAMQDGQPVRSAFLYRLDFDAQ